MSLPPRSAPGGPATIGNGPAPGAGTPRLYRASSTSDSLRNRLEGTLPLFLISAALGAAAWAVSVYRVRLFGSEYPLWIILALDAGVIAVAGTAALFLREPDRTDDDDSDMVRVPRVVWESSQHRSAAAGTGSGRSPTKGASNLASGGTDALALRRETGMIEIQDIAERAIFTHEERGGIAVQKQIEASAHDLIQIAKMLGAPRRSGETPSTLLIRLLGLPLQGRDFPQGRLTPADTERRLAQLIAIEATPADLLGSRDSQDDLAGPQDEFDALLQELEQSGDPATRTNRGSTTRKNVESTADSSPQGGSCRV